MTAKSAESAYDAWHFPLFVPFLFRSAFQKTVGRVIRKFSIHFFVFEIIFFFLKNPFIFKLSTGFKLRRSWNNKLFRHEFQKGGSSSKQLVTEIRESDDLFDCKKTIDCVEIFLLFFLFSGIVWAS